MLACCICFIFGFVHYNSVIYAQKLVVIIVDGLSGSHFDEFAHLQGFRTFQEKGIWSTVLYPEFPTLSLPNRHALMTGLSPSSHGIIGEYMYDWSEGRFFYNFEHSSDFHLKLWWHVEPMYITAQKAGAPTALFYFPECEVNWETVMSICIPPKKDLEQTLDNITVVNHIIETTNTHDLVIVNHATIQQIIEKNGRKRTNNFEVLNRFSQALELFQANVQNRIDLNMIVLSTHGFTDVPASNVRILDNYIPMELIDKTIGFGAVKQIIGYPGKTHQIYSQLRYISPIPNVKIYYTAANFGDLPDWYHYRKSKRIPDLVLIATPGYAIYTREEKKQIPKPSEVRRNRALSGYNNRYPDMLGLFFAYGPINIPKRNSQGTIKFKECVCDNMHDTTPTLSKLIQQYNRF